MAPVTGAGQLNDPYRPQSGFVLVAAATVRTRSPSQLWRQGAPSGRPVTCRVTQLAQTAGVGARQTPPDALSTVRPFVRAGLPQRPLFLLVVKGIHCLVGKKKPHYKHRNPAFYLISAVQQGDTWQLRLPIEPLLAWLWQRWELEVAHREMKSGLGVGE